MELKEMIVTLAQASGPAGFENGAIAAARELLTPLVDEVSTDVMGNLIGWRRCGKPGADVVMLDAHMDEVGLIVTGYERGFLRFHNLGGIDARILPALEVTILAPEGPLHGVVDVLPPHVVPPAEREKPLAMEKLFIDAGFESEEEAKAHVPLGTAVVYSTPCFAMGEFQLAGKALDDRSCAAVILSAMDQLRDKPLAVDLAVHLAVQEEVGGRGALTGAFAIHPDYAVAVDVTFAGAPGTPAHKSMKRNGGTVIDVGPAVTRKVSDKLEQVAKAKNIPYQIEVVGGYSGTDGDEIRVTREGVATGVTRISSPSVPL